MYVRVYSVTAHGRVRDLQLFGDGDAACIVAAAHLRLPVACVSARLAAAEIRGFRGFWEGDGCVSIMRLGNAGCHIRIVAHKLELAGAATVHAIDQGAEIIATADPRMACAQLNRAVFELSGVEDRVAEAPTLAKKVAALGCGQTVYARCVAGAAA